MEYPTSDFEKLILTVKDKRKTPERELKNVRHVLSNNKEDFAKSLGITIKELEEIESGKRKLSASELVNICEIIRATLESIEAITINVSDVEKSIRIGKNKAIIMQVLSKYLDSYESKEEKGRTKIKI